MLTYGNILHFPSSYSKRNQSLKDIKYFSGFIMEKNPEELSIKFTMDIQSKNGIYTPTILVSAPNALVSVASPVKIYCNCKSFEFEFAKAIYEHDGLLNEDKFTLFKYPREKNIYLIPSGCKHIIFLANYAIKHFRK